MKKKVRMICTVSAILLALFLPSSHAGTVIDQRMKDREGQVTRVILYCSGGRLRTDRPESGLTTIMDFDKDRIVLVNHSSREYLLMSLSLWEKEVAGQLRRENPSLRPRERVISLRKMGETAVVNGFNSVKVQVLADGELIEEHWMTRDIDMDEFNRVMEKAARSKEFQSELKEGREIQRQIHPYGFSVLVKDYTLTQGLGAIDVLEVKKIEKKDLADSVFTPPSGYDRIVPKK